MRVLLIGVTRVYSTTQDRCHNPCLLFLQHPPHALLPPLVPLQHHRYLIHLLRLVTRIEPRQERPFIIPRHPREPLAVAFGVDEGGSGEGRLAAEAAVAAAEDTVAGGEPPYLAVPVTWRGGGEGGGEERGGGKEGGKEEGREGGEGMREGGECLSVSLPPIGVGKRHTQGGEVPRHIVTT